MLKDVREWVRWEFGRTIEVSGFIKFIILERFFKGTVLILGGVALLVLGATNEWTKLFNSIQEQFNFNPHHTAGLWHRLFDAVVLKFSALSGGTQTFIAIGSMSYGLLEGIEGWGLVRRRRWAEYLVLVATVFFIPLEVDEMIRHFTLVKLGLFAVNVAIVVYLIWRKRLFLERRGEDAESLSTNSA